LGSCGFQKALPEECANNEILKFVKQGKMRECILNSYLILNLKRMAADLICCYRNRFKNKARQAPKIQNIYFYSATS